MPTSSQDHEAEECRDLFRDFLRKKDLAAAISGVGAEIKVPRLKPRHRKIKVNLNEVIHDDFI